MKLLHRAFQMFTWLRLNYAILLPVQTPLLYLLVVIKLLQWNTDHSRSAVLRDFVPTSDGGKIAVGGMGNGFIAKFKDNGDVAWAKLIDSVDNTHQFVRDYQGRTIITYLRLLMVRAYKRNTQQKHEPLKARIQSPKCWCENSYMHMATGTGYTIKNYPANLALPAGRQAGFTKIQNVIFVHGCFWHGHTNCKYFVVMYHRH